MPKILTRLQMLDPAQRVSISPIGSIFAGRIISPCWRTGCSWVGVFREIGGPSEELMPSLSL
jgi:hypothetical protein